MQTRHIDRLVIAQTNKQSTYAWVKFGQQHFPCRIGYNGIGTSHREGSRTTPRGIFNISYVLLRTERTGSIKTALPKFSIMQSDSWDDDPASRSYNKPLAHLVDGSDEALWRADSLYDIIFVITHNTSPVIPALGSAIFLHVSGKDRYFTEGCVAVSIQNIKNILGRCGKKTRIHIC